MKGGAARAREPESSSRWKTIAWLIGPLAVVAIVAFILLRQPSEASPTGSHEPPNPVAAPTPTPFPTQDARPVEVASLEVQSAAFEKDATVNGFALAGERVIAVGYDGEGAAAWYSDDEGSSWTGASVQTLDPPRPGAVAEMSVVAAHDGTLAAIGTWHVSRRGIPSVLSTWISTDAGVSWIEQPRDEASAQVQAAVGQFLTAGEMGFVTIRFSSYPTLLVSPDGSSWDAMENDTAIAKAQFRDIVGRGDTLLAVGVDTSTTPSSFLTPDAWIYTDAAGWTTLNDRFSGSILGDLVADASGFYASGMVLPNPETSEGSLAAMWESPDGVAWQQRVLSSTPDLETGPIAHGPLGTLVMGDVVGPAKDGSGPHAFAWFVRNRAAADEEAQEYPIAWNARAAIALPDRFLVFGVCGQDATDCSGPAILTVTASNLPYRPSPSG